MEQKFYLPQEMLDVVPVAIVGAGGTGGEMLENMVRLHFLLKELGHPGLKISIFDHDVVSESNIGRTRFMPTDVGENKAELLASRFSMAYGIDIDGYPAAFQPWVSGGVISYKLFITCTDSADFRLSFSRWFDSYIRYGELWLDLGNEKLHGQVVLGTSENHGGSEVLPHAVSLFRKSFEEALKQGESKDSCSLLEAVEMQSLYINKTLASHASHMLFELFKQGWIDYHGLFLDLGKGSLDRIPINPDVWRFFGYEPSADRAA